MQMSFGRVLAAAAPATINFIHYKRQTQKTKKTEQLYRND